MRKTIGAILVAIPVCYAIASFVARYGWRPSLLSFIGALCFLGGLYLLLEDQR